MSEHEKTSITSYNKPDFVAKGDGNLKRTFFGILILGSIVGLAFLFQYLADYGKYKETVCFQSFPEYCEYEMSKVEDGITLYKPLVPGLFMFQNSEEYTGYSDRRMPQFNFNNIVKNPDVYSAISRYCTGLTWISVPCDEPHNVELDLKAKNNTVFWWEEQVVPAKGYPINK